MDTTKLIAMGAWQEVVEWASRQRNCQQAWDDCPQGDWMLWFLSSCIKRQGSSQHRKLVLCTCAIARTALKYVPEGDERPRRAVEIAENWARHEGATLDDVRIAAYDVNNYASADAQEAYAAAAAHAAAVTADTVTVDVECPYHASFVATVVAAVTAVYVDGMWNVATTNKRTADIVRDYFPKVPRC